MNKEITSITEAYIAMYGESCILTEQIHSDIQSIMDNESVPVANKFSMVTKKARDLIRAGVDTGMESDKPKKGSSRAVFFPKNPKNITVDGKETTSPTAIKIAFSGTLDKHHGDSSLLGEDQNAKESDHFVNGEYGILSHDRGNEYKSNTHESGGVLAPVFETHQEHHHLEMGRVTPATSKDIAEATKNKHYPNGLKHEEIQSAMEQEHFNAHGQNQGYRLTSKFDDEHLENVKLHPWVEHAIDMMHNSGMHPGDLEKRNMGIYHHPVTGKKHLAIIDYGYSSEIAKKYTLARRNWQKTRELRH